MEQFAFVLLDQEPNPHRGMETLTETKSESLKESVTGLKLSSSISYVYIHTLWPLNVDLEPFKWATEFLWAVILVYNNRGY